MKTSFLMAVAALALAVGWLGRAEADTADAECQVRKKGDLAKDASGPCTFSQRQGHIGITLKNGSRYDLSPGERPGHFADQNGHGVERTSAGGGVHTYKWDHMQIVVTFGGAAEGGNQPAAAGGDQSPADLKDLVNGRLTGAEVGDELMRRGFKESKNEVTGDDVYSYWKSSKGQCVVVHFDAARRVASIAPAFASSCK